MKFKIKFYLILIFSLLTTSCQSWTPYKLVKGNQTDIEYFNIRGCGEEWCRLAERTDYWLEINFTLSRNVDNPKMTYTLISELEGFIHSSGYMPILCGSLVRYTCPLKKGTFVNFRAPFQLVAYPPWISFLILSIRATYLYIDLFPEQDSRDVMYTFKIKIKLETCLIHTWC